MRAFFSKIASFFRKAAPVAVKVEPMAAAVAERIHPSLTPGISMAEAVYKSMKAK